MKFALTLSGCLAFAAMAQGDTSTNAVLKVDCERHAVTFSAVSTDCGIDTPLEFLFVGPTSDHDYEAMFTTEATVGELADAFARAGIPLGTPYDPRTCTLWPAGERVSIEPAITNFVRDARAAKLPAVIFPGGSRLPGGAPVAHTNSPEAVFALYNLGQSLMQFDDALEQSVAYGRFVPAVKIPKGERRNFTVSWNGQPSYEKLTVEFKPGELTKALTTLKEKSAERVLEVLVDFSPELTLSEAIACAKAVRLIDSRKLKLNGFKAGQLFYQSYLPDENWRNRQERLAQPPEVHFLKDGSFRVTEIKEDWSNPESIDPKLTPVEHSCSNLQEAAKIASKLAEHPMTIFIYADGTTKLKAFYDLRAQVKTEHPIVWYVFTE